MMKRTMDATTLLHRFLHWESMQPDTIFLTQPAGDDLLELDWKTVGEQARRLAAQLLALGIEPGGRVALLGKNSAHWVIADIAIMMAGLVSVPIYPTMSGETVRYILDHADVGLLIVGKLGDGGDNWKEIERALPGNMPTLALPQAPPVSGISWERVLEQEPLSAPHLPDAGEICTIIYTSGSTGKPKGVVHSHAGVMAAQTASARRNRILPGDRLLCYLPLAHVAERLMAGLAIHNGLRIYFNDSLATFGSDIARARPTIFLSVPRLWVKFRQQVDAAISPSQQRWLFALPGVSRFVRRRILCKLGLDQVRIAISGSAPISPDVIRWFQKLGLEVLEGYGMTENFGISHCTEAGRLVPGQVGTPFEGVAARIDDTGEILVRCPAQMIGYHLEPELTAQCLTKDGFFRTGDRGTIDGLGALTITGRIKDNFKTAKGKYVAPVPIENAIRLAGIEAVCVLGTDRPAPFVLLLPSAELRRELVDRQRREAIHATIAQELRRLNMSLEPHERLSHAVLVDAEWTSGNGLLTPTLKIVRSAIERKYGALSAAAGGERIPV